MNQSSWLGTDRFLFHNTKNDFAIFNQHAVVIPRIGGFRIRGAMDVDASGDAQIENLPAGPKGYRPDDDGVGMEPVPIRYPKKDALLQVGDIKIAKFDK